MRRQPFLRTSVKTKSSSSPLDLEHRRAPFLFPRLSGRERMTSRNSAGTEAGARRSPVRGQCASAIVAKRQVEVACDISHGADGRARELLPIVFCSIEITGERPKTKSTSGFANLSDEALGVARQAIRDSGAGLPHRWCRRPELDFPEPERPVTTISRFSWQFDRDVLQIVNAGALYCDGASRAWVSVWRARSYHSLGASLVGLPMCCGEKRRVHPR